MAGFYSTVESEDTHSDSGQGAFVRRKHVDFSILFPPNMNYEYFEDAAQVAFEPAEIGLSLAHAWWLAESSLLAYEHPGFTRLVLRLLGAENFRYFAWKSTRVIVFTVHGVCITAFRGTEVKSTKAIADIITDVSFGMVPFYDKGLVHGGIKRAFDECLSPNNNLFDYITHLHTVGKAARTYFTGHSLGGALAKLAAAYYRGPQGCLYTFGALRVGNPVFARHLPQRVYRFVNAGDPFPYLPPNIPGLAKGESVFASIGELCFFDSDHRLQLNPQKVPQHIGGLLSRNFAAARQHIGQRTRHNLQKLLPQSSASQLPDAGEKASGDGVSRKRRQRAFDAAADLIHNSNLDAHAPSLYTTNIWNEIAARSGTIDEGFARR